MKCKNCQAELPEDRTFCSVCGVEIANDAPPMAAEQPAAIEAEIVAQEQPSESIQPAVVENHTVAEASFPQTMYAGQYPVATAVKPPKKKWKIVLPIIGAVILIAAIAVLIYMSGADGRTVEEARRLAQNEEYFEALNLLNTIKDPGNDTEIQINAVKEDIFDDMESEIIDLITEESYDEAIELLETYSILPNYQEVTLRIYDAIEENIEEILDEGDSTAALEMLEKFPDLPSYNDMQALVYTALEEDVQAFMNEGDYVAAQEFLNGHAYLTNYDKLCRQVKYETFLIQCAFDLRPRMKNPRSLMITGVEIYESESEYPTIIFDVSGQNGFGGYTTSYVVFDNDDLTYLGMCSSIYEPDDDEYLTAYLIRMYRLDPEITDAVFDLERINQFLADGNMPTIDFVQYISTEGSNV